MSKHRKMIKILTLLIGLCLISIVCVVVLNEDSGIKLIGITAGVILLFVWLILEYRNFKKYNQDDFGENIKELFEKPITRFVLMNPDGGREKEWYVSGANSFLIGKGTHEYEVDIELGDTHYCDYISNEHAVLNFSNGFWYIEDLDSKNGVGVQKDGEEYVLRLRSDVSYKIDVGDVLYISKVKILVM